ncbi:MAG: hypothetical protein FJ224_06940, partial [Lentisphaerae bacterium]|nr:hypothetical protein [Lentisphaerota bacterium]
MERPMKHVRTHFRLPNGFREIVRSTAILVLLPLIILPAVRARAAVFDDTGTGARDWGVSGTWTLSSGTDADGVPDSDDDAIVDNDGTILLSDVRSIYNLRLAGNAVINFTDSSKSLTLLGPTNEWRGGNIRFHYLPTSAVTNRGTVYYTSPTQRQIEYGGSFQTEGPFIHATPAVLYIKDNDDFRFNVAGGGSYRFTAAGGTLHLNRPNAKLFINSGGTLSANTPGAASVYGAGVFDLKTGGAIEVTSGELEIYPTSTRFNNVSISSTLSAGAFRITDPDGAGGNVSRLDLKSAGNFTTIASGASVMLSGPDSVFSRYDNGTSLDASLTTVNGTLSLRNGRPMSLSGGFTLSGGRLEFGLIPPAATNSRLTINGTASLNGTIDIVNSGGMDNGTYVLIRNAGGTLGSPSLSLGTVPPDFTTQLVVDGPSAEVRVVVSRKAPHITNASGATSVRGNAAALNGYLTSTGIATTAVFNYWGAADGGTNRALWANTNRWAAPQNPGSSFSTNVTGLATNSIYFYRFSATNRVGRSWAQETSAFITGAIRLLATDTSASETLPDHAAFSLYRPISTTNGTLTVFYAVSGDASNGADYAYLSGTASFARGATNAAIPVTVIRDALAEPPETVSVRILPGPYLVAPQSNATITIQDLVPATLYDRASGAWANTNTWETPNGSNIRPSFPPRLGDTAIVEAGVVTVTNADTAASVAVRIHTNGTVTVGMGGGITDAHKGTDALRGSETSLRGGKVASAYNRRLTSADIGGNLTIDTAGTFSFAGNDFGAIDDNSGQGVTIAMDEITIPANPSPASFTVIPAHNQQTLTFLEGAHILGNATVNAVSNGTVLSLGPLDGTGTLIKNGAGNLRLSRPAAGFTGRIEISQGNIQMTAPGPAVMAGGALVVRANASLLLSVGGSPAPAFLNAASVVITNSSIEIVSAGADNGLLHAFGGAISVRGSGVSTIKRTATLGGAATLHSFASLSLPESSSGTLRFTSDTDVGEQFQFTDTVSLNGRWTIDVVKASNMVLLGEITGTGSMEKTGAGSVVMPDGGFFTTLVVSQGGIEVPLGATLSVDYLCSGSQGVSSNWVPAGIYPSGTFPWLTGGGSIAVGFNGPPWPIPETRSASSIKPGSATLNGALTSAGDNTAYVRIYWGETDGTNNAAAWNTNVFVGAFTDAAVFGTNVTGLVAGQMYYYRVFATNSYGAAWAASSRSFTVPSDKPSVTNAAASQIGAGSATLNGILVSTGRTSTAVFAYWGPTDGGTNAAQWAATNKWISPRQPGLHSLPLTSLAANGTFRFRYSATNSYGRSWAPSTSAFTTGEVGIRVKSHADESTPSSGMFEVYRPRAATNLALTVRYALAPSSTAVQGTDFETLPGSVLLPAGATNATIALRPYDDSLVEGSETVSLTLLPGNYALSAQSNAVMTITDDEDISVFSRRMRIRFPGYTGASPLSDFPALVTFRTSTAGFYSTFSTASPYEMRFFDDSVGTALPFEVEEWSTSGNSHIWVKIPSLSGTNTSIWVFWGRPVSPVPATSTNGAVWGNNFVGVWHMNETISQNKRFPDSTAAHHGTFKANDGTPNSTRINGVAGYAVDFNDTDYIDVADEQYFNLGANITVSCWVRDMPDGGWEPWVSKYGESGQGWQLRRDNSSPPRLAWTTRGITTEDYLGTAPTLNDGPWHFVVGTLGGGRREIYLDGSLNAGENKTGTIAATSDRVAIGARFANGVIGAFSGARIDEVRISSVARSSTWIRTEWLNAVSNSTFCLFEQPQLNIAVTNNAAYDLGLTYARIGGTLVADGGQSSTRAYVCWGTAEGGTSTGSWQNVVSFGPGWNAPAAFTTNITVTSNTFYRFRSFVTNAVGHAWADSSRTLLTAPVWLQVTKSTASEIGPTAATVTVYRSSSVTALPLSISFAVGGTASNGVDYATISSPVVMPAGADRVHIPISALDDTLWNEGAETATIRLLPGPYLLGSGTNATVSIFDKGDVGLWSKRMKISFPGYTAAETLSGLPVMVAMGPERSGFSYNDFASTNGYDLRFLDSTGETELPYEVERWQTSTNILSLPGTISGLSLWLDASDASSVVKDGNNIVTKWLDKAGSNRHADQVLGLPVFSGGALNGNSVLTFSGSDLLSTTYNFDSLNTNYTIFTVARYTGGANNRVISSTTRNWMFGFHGGRDECFHAEGWIYQGGNANTSWHLHAGEVRKAADPVAAFWKDGVQLERYSTGSDNANYLPGRMAFGGLNYVNGTELSACQVAEVLVYDRQLSQDEHQRVGAYLTAKWGLRTHYNVPGRSIAWVRLPSLTSSSYIWAHWGNPSAASAQPAYTTNGAVWSSGYRGVWHFAGDGRDSTSYRHNLTDGGSDNLLKARIASGRGFDGYNDYMVLGDVSTIRISAYTVSLWLNPQISQTQWGDIVGKDYYSANDEEDYNFALRANYWQSTTGGVILHHNWSDSAGGVSGPQGSSSVPFGRWSHAAIVNDASVGRTYINGIQDRQANVTGSLKVHNKPVYLARNLGGSNGGYFTGQYDELRIANQARSANWIRAEYMTMASNDVFTAYTPAQSGHEVSNLPANNAQTNRVTLSGRVDFVQGGTYPEVYVCWGRTNAGPTSIDSWENRVLVGNTFWTGDTFSTNVAVLPGYLYYYRCFMTNSVGYDWADDSGVFLSAAVNVSASDQLAVETGNNTATFLFSRPPSASAESVTVSFSVGGTATEGVDYDPLPRMVTIPAGQSSTTLVLTPIYDRETEVSETVTITLTNTAHAVTSSVPASATIADGSFMNLNVIWDNAAANGKWENNGSKNWHRIGFPSGFDRFFDGDSVSFSSPGGPVFVQTAGVAPSSIAISGTNAFTFSSGVIRGTGTVSVSGYPTAVFAVTNAWTGPTYITGGMLATKAPSSQNAPGNPFGASSTFAGNGTRLAAYDRFGSFVGFENRILNYAGSEILLDNSLLGSPGNGSRYRGASGQGRWGDTATITLRGSSLLVRGGNMTAVLTPVDEDVGAISLNALSAVTISPATTRGGASITADRLVRNGRAVLAAGVTGLDSADIGSVLRLSVERPPASSNGMLPPWILITNSMAFALYDNDNSDGYIGIAPKPFTATSLSSALPEDVVRISSSATAASNRTAHALS